MDKHTAKSRPLGARLVAGASWSLLSKLLTNPAGLVLTMLLARILSPEEMGGYFLATSLIAIVLAVVQMGMGWTIVKLISGGIAARLYAKVRQVIRTILGGVFILSLSAALIIAINGDAIISILEGGNVLRDSMRWIAVLIVAMAMMELLAETLRGFHDYFGASLLVDQFLQRIFLLVILIPLWFADINTKLVDVFEYSTLASTIACVIGLYLLRRNLASCGKQGGRVDYGEIVRHAPPFLMMRINNWTLNFAGIWVLGMFRPADEVAVYGAVNIVSMLVLAPQMLMNGVVAPAISELYHNKNMYKLMLIARTAAFAAMIPAALLTLVFILFGDVILVWIYGVDYQAGVVPMIILAAGRTVAALCGVPAIMLAMTDNHRLVLRVTTAVSVVAIVAYFYFAQDVGVTGVAAVTAISIAAQNILLVLLVKKKLDVIILPIMTLGQLTNIVAVMKKSR